MRTLIATVGLSLTVTVAAYAGTDTQTPGTVPYYITHPAERAAMDHQCGFATGWPQRCQAAQKADEYIGLAKAQQRVAAGRHGVGSIDSPAYYDHWPIARQMTLNQCAHPTGGWGDPTPSTCQAARVSAGLMP